MRSIIRFAPLAAALLLAGCAGTPGAPAGSAAPAGGSVPAAADTSRGAQSPASASAPVLDLRLRRAAELTDTQGALRLFDQDLSVEFRAGGRGPGLDAGEVTLDGRPLRREVNSKGAVSYRLGRDEPEGGLRAGGNPWSSLAIGGGTAVPASNIRVKLAPFPLVTQPTPGSSVLRTEDLNVIMLPPVPDVWYRVSLTGPGDPVTASDLGEGRWVFPRGALEALGIGRARLLVEVEASCGDCTSGGPMRVIVSSRSEMEIALTLL